MWRLGLAASRPRCREQRDGEKREKFVARKPIGAYLIRSPAVSGMMNAKAKLVIVRRVSILNSKEQQREVLVKHDMNANMIQNANIKIQ